MTEKDSRRIFYFMAVNFTFMGVQAVYGYLTDSLGLLSDSIHMFFDCVALAVGLFASVMSKWPPSERFPYGFGKIETLSGFANGVFLILISLEIMFEGFERLVEGRETKRLQELFINMHGIYLHILADTLGSASVILSTVLTYIFPWSGWDPAASLLIAYLILMTAIPLVKSSAQRLLLTIPADTEYNLRNTLSEITNQRGVAAYSVPKFWVDDRAGTDSGGKLLGVVHVAAVRGADMEEVRDRVKNYLAKHGIDLTIQMEREGEAGCWCGMGRLNSISKGPLGY
ncbi:putative zinc transporter msc2 [Diatrype stigma]|uniref:Zinc transporter n=1 Tax=Diatrype stigma TaxID=117547 RepID=A0AAN9U7R8_9PEZI